MAGATNRAMKAAGIPKASQKVIRLNSGGAHTLKSAIAVAAAHGAPIPDKVHAHIAARDGKVAAKSEKAAEARRAENAAFEAQHRARTEARKVYEGQNAIARGNLNEMRGNIRRLVTEKRQADADMSNAVATAKQKAGARLGIPKKGPKARQNQREHENAINAAVNADQNVRRAAMMQVQARTALQSALQSRNATATARKAQRGAEAGGQQDLFSGAPAPRQPSPFERRMAMRDARALRGAQSLGAVMAQRRKQDAARPARAATLAKSIAAASANAMAARRAAATSPANLIRSAEKKHLSGMTIAGSRDFARRRMIDVGTARAKLTEAKAAHAKATAAVAAARGKYERGKAESVANHTSYSVRKAQEVYSGHMATVKETMRAVRKAEASLPPDVRAQVRPQKQAKASLGSSPEARAKMAAAKARLPELRAAKHARMMQRVIRGAKVAELRDNEIKYEGANQYRGKVAESMGRAQRYGNSAISSIKRLAGQQGLSAADSARKHGKSLGWRQYKEKHLNADLSRKTK